MYFRLRGDRTFTISAFKQVTVFTQPLDHLKLWVRQDLFKFLDLDRGALALSL